MEREEAVPVTAIADDTLQRELFNLAGVAEDDADFDRMEVLVTRFHCDPNARNSQANYHYTPMHQAGEPSLKRELDSRTVRGTIRRGRRIFARFVVR